MKDKSPLNKRGSSLNESSSTLVEPSFSKITFRRRGHDVSFEMPDIAEVEDGPMEGVSQVSDTHNSTDHHKNSGKKKKKKKKQFLDCVPQELNICKEGFADANCGEEKPIVGADATFESVELNCSMSSSSYVKKRKKKKSKTHVSQDSLNELNLSQGLKYDGNEESETVEGDLEAVLETNKFPLKKKKSKRKKLSFIEEEPEASTLQEKNSPQSEKYPLINKEKNYRFEPVHNDETENVNNEEFSESVTTSMDSSSKKHKRKSSLSGENFVTVDDFDSPLLHKKKKKTQKLLDESHMDLSNNEQFPCSISGTKNTGVVNCGNLALVQDTDIPLKTKKKKKIHKSMDELHAFQSAKTHKKKHKFFSESIMIQDDNPLESNEFSDEKIVDSDFGSHMSVVSERSNSDKTLSQPTERVACSPRVNHEQLGENENNDRPKKKHKKNKHIQQNNLTRILDLPIEDNIMTGGERESKHLKSLALGELVDSHSTLPVSNLKELQHKNKETFDQLKNNNREAKSRKISTAPEVFINGMDPVTSIGPVKIKKGKNKSKTMGKDKEGLQNDIASPKKKNYKIEALRKQLLKEALSGTEESEDLPHKPTKPKTKVNKITETLKMHLLKEAFSAEEKSKNCPSKLTKPKVGVEENVDALRSKLLKEAFSSTTKSEDSLKKRTKVKNKFKESVKDSSGDKNKKGINKVHKHSKDNIKKLKKIKDNNKKSNDIEKLTDILISKALQKVSSSSASHSSQENINMLNVERTGKDVKEHGLTKNKIVKVKKHKSTLSQPKTNIVQEKVAEGQSEKDKIQKSLLISAIQDFNPEFKSSKTKLKKKAPITSDKFTPKNINNKTSMIDAEMR